VTDPENRPDGGRVVRNCFGAGINTLTQAIRALELTTTQAICRHQLRFPYSGVEGHEQRGGAVQGFKARWQVLCAR
jgi:hypothetical protein